MSATLTRAPETGIGRYDFLELAGQGAMGTVYRAADHQTGEIVAVKVLNVKLDENPVLLARFLKEFQTAAKLEHPNIVRAIELGSEDGVSFLVTEFVAGLNLGELIAKRGKLAPAEAVRFITQITQALHYAHLSRVVHRDVKPDNILIRSDGVAKLADFGLAKDWDNDQDLTRQAHGLGTPHFMAPEQYRDAKHAGTACDIYALGATLYNAITGTIPFAGCASLIALSRKVKGDIPSARDLVPSLPETVDLAIRRAMDPDPSRRPSSCLEFFRLMMQPPRRGTRPQPHVVPADVGEDDRRQAVRVGVALGTSCVVETGIHGGEQAFQEWWPLILRDVSGLGVGFLLARRFESGTKLAIEFATEPNAPPRCLSVRVVRVKADALGHWLHGCVFEPRPSASELGMLLKHVAVGAAAS